MKSWIFMFALLTMTLGRTNATVATAMPTSLRSTRTCTTPRWPGYRWSQRSRALNCFIDDIYNKQKILAIPV